jgi:LPXTG-motif cell wall-anchored protein
MTTVTVEPHADAWGVGDDVRASTPTWTERLRARGPELAVTVAALVMFAWGLSKNGYGNSYYAAAARSMASSWHNFLYGALDPGGWITTDKPPLALWLQALSVRAFGYSSWSMLMPSVVAGAGSVALVMATVRRVWGRTAGLAAGIALALTPVVLAVSRSNNPDATLVLCVVAAAYATQRAISERRPGWLALAGLFCGLGFLAKLLAAGLVMPGLWLAYLLTGPNGWWRRVRDLAVATLVFLAVAAAWVALFDLTPASSRPYVGGSTDGTALDLVFGYDGFGRLTGNGSPAGGGGPGGGAGITSATGINQFGGATGLGRLFNNGMGDQVMWLAVLAGVALVGGLVVAARRRRRDAELGSLVLWGGWAVVTYLVFAYAKGVFHNYYVALLAPAVAALVGIGVELVRRHGRRAAGLLAGAAAGTAWLQVVLLRRVDAYQWLRVAVPVALAVIAVAAVVLAVRGLLGRITAGGLGIAALGVALVASATWTWAGTRTAQSGTFPDARPATAVVDGGFAARRGVAGPGGPPAAAGLGGGASLSSAELSWLARHSKGAKWVLAVSSSMQADSAIIAGYSVMAMGGFSGSDPAMTPAKLADLVKNGELRYVSGAGGGLAGGFGGPGGAGGSGGLIQGVAQVCTAVDASSWGGSDTSTVYDCAGKASALRKITVSRQAQVPAPSGGGRTGNGVGPAGGGPGGTGGPGGAGFQQVAACLQEHGIDLSNERPDPTDAKVAAALAACGAPVPPR